MATNSSTSVRASTDDWGKAHELRAVGKNTVETCHDRERTVFNN